MTGFQQCFSVNLDAAALGPRIPLLLFFVCVLNIHVLVVVVDTVGNATFAATARLEIAV